VAEQRRHVKALTRELRTSPDRAAQSRAAQIDPYLAYGIDWRRGDGEEEVFLVLSNEGVLHTLRSSTGTFSRTSDEEANRQKDRVAYALTLLRGDGVLVESLALTRWMHQSSDPLPARLRRELGSKGIGLG